MATDTPEETFFQILARRSPLRELVRVKDQKEKQASKTWAYFHDEDKPMANHPYTFTKNEYQKFKNDIRAKGEETIKYLKENNLKGLLSCLKSKEVKFNQDDEICSYNNSNQILGVILSGKAYVKKLDRNGNYTILETLNKNDIFSDSFIYTATDANAISIFSSEQTVVLFFDFESVFKRCSNACG